jgi:chromosome segregation ATPase
MASDSELDELVEQADEILRERGEKVNSRAVLKLVKHRAEDVLRAYQRFTDRQRAIKAAELSQAISPAIAEALVKDRESHTEAKTQLLRDEVEQLSDDCEVLQEEITGLRNELSETQEQSSKEQASLNETLNDLQLIKTGLEGEINKHLGEIKVLTDDRDKAHKERDEAKDKRSRMQCTLAVKAEAERRERNRAKKLKKLLDEADERIVELDNQVPKLQKRKSPSKASN